MYVMKAWKISVLISFTNRKVLLVLCITVHVQRGLALMRDILKVPGITIPPPAGFRLISGSSA